MCGIIGYLGNKEAGPILIESLKRLEYRGYDSAGIAILDSQSGHCSVKKSAHRVEDLIAQIQLEIPAGHLGVGHTRWATHGRPSLANAHPHVDCAGKIVVVHNGIIENFMSLKSLLEAQGHQFSSDTDSEVIPHLVESFYRGDLVEAVYQSLPMLKGIFAFAIFAQEEPELLIGVRCGAPLVVGLNEGEWYVSSDITAILPYTNRVLVLGEREMVQVRSPEPLVTNFEGRARESQIITAQWDDQQSQKDGFAHFMLKEIYQTPDAAANSLRGRTGEDGGVNFLECNLTDTALANFSSIHLSGMGTSLHAAMVGAKLLGGIARVWAQAEDASELRDRSPILGSGDLAVFLTQSGETADTLGALRLANELGAWTLAITNVPTSPAVRDSRSNIFLGAGPEISVASTKTFISHLMVLSLLAIKTGVARQRVSPVKCEELIQTLRDIPDLIRSLLVRAPEIQELAQKYREYENFMVLGRGINFPIALEGALKIKEVSYVHAEGVSAGALKHGPIALLDSKFPVIALCTESPTLDKTINSVYEVAAREAPVLAVVSSGEARLGGIAKHVFAVETHTNFQGAILNAVFLQLFAYWMAVERGCEVDQPRNLAKSVTVE